MKINLKSFFCVIGLFTYSVLNTRRFWLAVMAECSNQKLRTSEHSNHKEGPVDPTWYDLEMAAMRKEIWALQDFIRGIGFAPDKVASCMLENSDLPHMAIALSALTVTRDFSKTSFSPAGVDASNRWLDSLRPQIFANSAQPSKGDPHAYL